MTILNKSISKFLFISVVSLVFFAISNSVLAADFDTPRVTNYTKNKIKTDLEKANLQLGSPIFLRSFKKENHLELWIKETDKPTYKLFRSYFICKYSGGLGPKQNQGDKMAPEGFYDLKPANLHPQSNFHLAINLGYPNAYDRYYHRSGSMLMIHGNCVSIGCYAMGDSQIEEVYYLIEQAFANGQPDIPVHLFPFRLTKDNLGKYHNNRWYSFWLELQSGYQYVETYKQPPKIIVESGKYVITE